VLLLHGFAESFHMWRSQLPALAAAGYRAVAPSQRGYSAGARPDTTDVANYQFDRLVTDAMNVVATSGHANSRFHLVGHDWGASIAWGIAHQYPDRVASLTVLSRPHRLVPTLTICRFGLLDRSRLYVPTMLAIGTLRHSPRRIIFGRSWSNSRQRSARKLNGYAAIDPQRSWARGP
jgi:pimeloyl-ACP methyl ester carboxylesterase